MGSVTMLPPLTRADLDRMPDDGHRYELIDGALIVTPAPAPLHQYVVANLLDLLRAARHDRTYAVVGAPLDVAISDSTVMQPDVLVAYAADFTRRDLPKAPLLAVEVLSPSTEHIDRMLKRSRFETAGCPSFWVVDPKEPSLVAWTLVDGKYAEEVAVTGGEVYHAELPYPVDVVPDELLLP